MVVAVAVAGVIQAAKATTTVYDYGHHPSLGLDARALWWKGASLGSVPRPWAIIGPCIFEFPFLFS